jgi:hypothetical protein
LTLHKRLWLSKLQKLIALDGNNSFVSLQCTRLGKSIIPSILSRVKPCLCWRVRIKWTFLPHTGIEVVYGLFLFLTIDQIYFLLRYPHTFLMSLNSGFFLCFLIFMSLSFKFLWHICRLSVEKQIHQIKQICCQSKTQKDRYKSSTNDDDRSIIYYKPKMVVVIQKCNF